MVEKEHVVHVSVKTDRLDNPSPTEGQFVEVIFVLTDKETNQGYGFATFRLFASQPEMPRGDDGDLFYITQAQRYFRECAESTAVDRADLRSGNQGILQVMTPLDVRIKNILNDE